MTTTRRTALALALAGAITGVVGTPALAQEVTLWPRR